MYFTKDYENTHSYKSVIRYNDVYYCYNVPLNLDDVFDAIAIIDFPDDNLFIEEISEGVFHATN
jgi:hypothetical protein